MHITQLSLAELYRGLRNGKVSSHSLMQASAQNYQQYEPACHAYKTWNGETALCAAQAVDTLLASGIDAGPLMGIPVSVKDIFGVPGLPTFAGSSAPLDAEWQKAGDVVQSVLRQAALVTGKTHTVEFAFGGLGVNGHWGTPRNPWDMGSHRIPGGSSSGAGVSLCQGSAMLALGTDTAGSVRIPASVTGTVGLKTTQGRWAGSGIVPLSSTLDSPGLLARSVEDVVFGFNAMDPSLTGTRSTVRELKSLAGIRFGVPENFFWEGADASIVALVEAAIARVAALGGKVVAVQVPHCDTAYEVFKAGGLAASELSAFLMTAMPEKVATLDPVVQARVVAAEAVSSVEYVRRCEFLKRISLEAASLFDDVDVLLTPTVAITPPRLADIQDGEAYRNANMMVLRNPSMANLMRLCALTMPVGKDSQQMPAGLQLICGPMQEAKLLAIAWALEKKLGKPIDLLGKPPLLICNNNSVPKGR